MACHCKIMSAPYFFQHNATISIYTVDSIRGINLLVIRNHSQVGRMSMQGATCHMYNPRHRAVEQTNMNAMCGCKHELSVSMFVHVIHMW